MRLFLAIDPDAAARAALADLLQSTQKLLGAASSVLRWVAADGVHLTLHFLGEVEPERARALAGAVEAPCTLRSFEVSLDRFGVFPPAGPPRTLWLGVGPGANETRQLHEELGRRLTALGFPLERRQFSPHLTVARVRDPQESRARHLRDLAAVAVRPIAWQVTQAVLCESDLSGPRPRYTAIASLTLGT
jgi:2'-5' RNA ligase